MSKKAPRLSAVATVDLPVVEASGVAARSREGHTTVFVVGDRTATMATAIYDGGFRDWETHDLSDLDGWPLGKESQMEAVAVDGGSLVAILIEDPPLVLVIDTDRRQLVAQVTLTAPAGSPLAGQWDDPSSRGEGLVLLRGGRLLVAKEKHPSALVEFSPVGMPSKGLSPDDLLDSGEAWETPAGTVDYAATSMWTLGPDAGDALEDISALAIARDQSLWMLSDKSETVGRLHLDAALSPGTGTIDRFDEVWRLPKRTKKPEGIAALDATRVLVAMDTGSTRHNGLVIERPE